MASTIKLKFAGFVRGLLRQLDDNGSARPVAPTAPPAVSAPAEILSAPIKKSDASANPVPSNDSLELPLAPVIAGLPMDLKAKLMATPPAGQTICLSVDAVVNQLAFGAVKISFGELRLLAPGVFANSGGEHDSRQVSLPLQEVLMRINPALLSRRSSQKVEVAEEVSGPFDGRGRGVNFTSHPMKPVAAVPAPKPLPMGLNHPAPAAPPQIKPPAAHRMGSPEPEAFSFTPRQTMPAAAPISFTPPVRPATPAPSNGNGNGSGNGNGNGHGHGNGQGNGDTGLPPFKFSAAPASTAPAASSAPRPEPAQPTLSQLKLSISLDDLAENWPDTLKQEIVQTLANVSAVLPFALIEPGLKKGRVTMSWKELRTLAKSNAPSTINDGLILDLPLKVLAPAFLAAQKRMGRGQKKVAVSPEIPNLFFGFPQSAPASVPAPAPAAAPVSAPVVMTAAPRPADTNFFGSHQTESLRMVVPATDFLNRQMHPKDVVSEAMKLPGVAGSVISLADGLRVASEVPAELNPETVAAFLPQIYERLNQSTRELRMGPLNNVSFTVGSVAWKIFRINAIYFAAFGRAGEKLPKIQLAALAAELDRKKQS